MLNIKKAPEFSGLEEFNKNHPEADKWNDIKRERELKKRLKEYILEKEQKVNEYYCCVYCERNITTRDSDSHLEHIKPKSKYPSEVFAYENLVVSCEGEGLLREVLRQKITCGHRKRDHFDEQKFVHPVLENPEEYFTYNEANGKVIPRQGLNGSRCEKAKDTIDILNLNDTHLTDTRAAALNILLSIEDKEELLYVIDNYPQFPGLMNFFKSELLGVKEKLGKK